MAINILCATDNNFAPYCGIMLTSLLENNRENNICIYLLVDETFSTTEQKKYMQLTTKHNQQLHIVTVDNKLLDGMPFFDLNHPITLPTYYRLLAGRLLPAHVHKIIHIDCDAIIAGNLKPLWDINLEGKAIACVKDCWINFSDDFHNRLGYSNAEGYFNAGVLVMNLDYWRTNGLDTRMEAYLQQHHDSLKYMDQDLLNGVLHSEKLWLPERYNFQPKFLLKCYWELYSDSFRDTLAQEYRQAVIVHYIGSVKPWQFYYHGWPFDKLWNHYCNISMWRKCRVRRPYKIYLKQMAKRILVPAQVRQQHELIWQTIAD